MDNHLVENKYVAQHYSEAFAAMLEVENKENLSKLRLSNSIHKSKVQSNDHILDQT